MIDSHTLPIAVIAVLLLGLWAIENFDELKLNFKWGKKKKSLEAKGKKHPLPKDSQDDRYLEEDSNRD